MGQDGGMSTQVLYPRVCPLQGAFCEGVTAIPFRGKPAVEVARGACGGADTPPTSRVMLSET